MQGKQTHLFDLIYRKYVISTINSIDFGRTVLTWLEYGDTPKHKTFIDEILNNKYRTINVHLLHEYKITIMFNNHNSNTFPFAFIISFT